jgi:anti-sigma-K factor RskA
MSTHDQFAEDLALYALGSLEGEDRARLEAHLESCASCSMELEALRGDMALLALSAPVAEPPPQARQRLLQAIAKEPRRVPAKPHPQSWWALVPSFAAAALAVVAMVLWLQLAGLRHSVSALEQSNAEQQQQLARASEVLSTLSDANAAHFTLSSTQAPPQPQPQGKAIYARDRHSLVFLANNMAPLPPQKTYELWLIPTSGAPIPAGLFVPDTHGSATIINPPLPAGVEAKTFAITVEPQQGSPAPTTQPIMVGTGT